MPGGGGDRPIHADASPARASSQLFETWVWLTQRVSALVLAICVMVHLATIVYATRSGLSAEAILSRTHASAVWPAFYSLFVVAVSVHAPIGLRAILEEWVGLRGRLVDVLLMALALAIFAAGVHVVVVMAR